MYDPSQKSDGVSPQGAGTPITWTAAVAGGEPPVLVRFWRRKSSPVVWTMVQDWAAATTYTWTPQPSEQGDWQVKAEARSEAVGLVQASRELAPGELRVRASFFADGA